MGRNPADEGYQQPVHLAVRTVAVHLEFHWSNSTRPYLDIRA
jgi:hypothetical protein